MANTEEKKIPLPEKQEGVQKDIERTIETNDEQAAKELYRAARKRLLNVNNWQQLCGAASAAFVLTDAKGQPSEGMPAPGLFIRINVPGPGSHTGDGYDWVQIELVEDKQEPEHDKEYTLMRVRPASNPANTDAAVAHFFSDAATSNFLVLREKKSVTAAVLGRNETPNVSKDTTLLDKLRNAVVGIGAALGMADPQWKNLVKGLLHDH